MAHPRHVSICTDEARWAAFRRRHPRTALDLREANLDEAHLQGDFSGVRFDGAYLKAASMPTQLNGAVFTGASLRRARLHGHEEYRNEFERQRTVFRNAHMSDAFLMHADFTGADFSGADLRGVRFTGALLSGTTFTAANLLDADFAGANLSGANFTGAIFKNTSFRGAIFSGTLLDAVDLGGAVGLDTVDHATPSIVSVAAVLRSSGRISESFLAKAHPGAPREQVRALCRAARAASARHHSCFISYAHADTVFVRRLAAALTRAGVPFWLDEQSLGPGDRFDDHIRKAIARSDRFVVVTSQAAVGSPWVQREVALAAGLTDEMLRHGVTADRDRQPRPLAPILPLRLDGAVLACEALPWSWVTTQAHVADFSNWRKAAAFEGQLDVLVDRLRRSRRRS